MGELNSSGSSDPIVAARGRLGAAVKAFRGRSVLPSASRKLVVTAVALPLRITLGLVCRELAPHFVHSRAGKSRS